MDVKNNSDVDGIIASANKAFDEGNYKGSIGIGGDGFEGLQECHDAMPQFMCLSGRPNRGPHFG